MADPALHVLDGKRVLVVDNEVAILAAVVDLLSPYGVRVDTAANAAEAERWVTGGAAYDLALLDYRLGGNLTGIELAKRIAGLQAQSLPVVLITGDTDSAEIRAMRAIGAEVHFKPLRGDALLSMVGEILSRKIAEDRA